MKPASAESTRRRSRRRARLGLLAALGTVLSLSAGCTAAPDPASPPALLVEPGDNYFSNGLHDTEPGMPYTFGFMTICLNRPGTVTISKVTPVEPYGGLRIDAFTTEPNLQEVGRAGDTIQVTPGAIADLRTTTGWPHVYSDGHDRVMNRPCGTGAPPVDGVPNSRLLIIQVSKATDVTAGDHGTDITYESGGRTYVLRMLDYVFICSARDRSRPCR